MSEKHDRRFGPDALTKGHADYGRIHFSVPKRVVRPTTPEELAGILKTCSECSEPVVIRNTGHSTNGQTLTTETQVMLAGLTGVSFDRDKLTATAGAGASWNDVIQGVKFPTFAPPIFPNNPGQLIHVGGTASVGGVGFYCSKYGGFWNHVSRLKLVTMQGEIIECSRQENAELFRYALGGYGRVGVIAEIDIDVVPSKPKVFAMVLAYFNDETFQRDLVKALNDPLFDGVAAQKDLSGWEARILKALGIDLKLLVVMLETDGDIDFREVAHSIRGRYDEELALFVDAGANVAGLELSLSPKLFDKRDVVYFSPTEQGFWRVLWAKIAALLGSTGLSATVDRTGWCHPWTDCIVSPARYGEFLDGAIRIIRDARLSSYLEKESFLSGLVDIDSFVTFGLRRMWAEPSERLPLSLDLPDVEAFSLGVAIMPNVPRRLLDKGLAVSREISDLVYACGGRRYLYGSHSLTKAQVEQHYGRASLDQWQLLKDEHDPKHLLNIGVIEHLDD